MADFEVPVVQIEEVIPIEGADRIEAVRIGGYQSIVEKGKYQVGHLAVYIPCSSLVPLSVQEELGLVGKLSGSRKDRVKEIKLKGVLSEGLVYPFGLMLDRAIEQHEAAECLAPQDWIGLNVAEVLGIEKYEPAVPAQFAGRVKPYPFTMGYDIENIKKHPRVFESGEPVVMSEKIHGTLIQVGRVHNEDGSITTFVTSKGMGKAGLIIEDNEANAGNLYVKTAKAFNLFECLLGLDEGQDIYLFGEVFGKDGQTNIQDLTYTGGVSGTPQFRAFDIYEGKKGKGRFLNVTDFVLACDALAIPTVNYIYEGPFSFEAVVEQTRGPETISGEGVHIREGVVVRPMLEREERRLGRVILKSVSEDYLLRKGGTEFN
jgi:RNA ligase (TIGR02306 family)